MNENFNLLFCLSSISIKFQVRLNEKKVGAYFKGLYKIGQKFCTNFEKNDFLVKEAFNNITLKFLGEKGLSQKLRSNAGPLKIYG